MVCSFPAARSNKEEPAAENADFDRVPGITRYAPA
jgi:hypothetical protein